MSKQGGAVAPRIGTGTGYFVSGGISIALAVVIGVGSSGTVDSEGGAVFATVLLVLGGGLIAVGFWVKLFGLVERRLIDIERRLPGGEDPVGKAGASKPIDDMPPLVPGQRFDGR